MSVAPTSAFAALSDDTRWAILTRLGDGPSSASALARELPISRQAIVKHLDILQTAGLVESEHQGREVVYRALGARLNELACDLERIARSWESRLARIQYLAEHPTEKR